MPYIKIQITDEGVTDEQKTQLIKGSTELLQRVLNKNPSTTVVVIEEVPLANWGLGGLPVVQYRQQLNEVNHEQ